MQQSKIEIIVNEAPAAEAPKPKKLGKLFAKATKAATAAVQKQPQLNKLFTEITSRLPKPDPAPTINGNNYFTGEIPTAARDRIGAASWHGLGADDWKYAWQAIGVKAPGELPKGAVFCLMVDTQEKGHHITPSVASVTRTGDKLDLQWEVNYTPVAKHKKRRVSFAAVVLPKTKHIESRYKHNRPEQPPVSIEAAKKYIKGLKF